MTMSKGPTCKYAAAPIQLVAAAALLVALSPSASAQSATGGARSEVPASANLTSAEGLLTLQMEDGMQFQSLGIPFRNDVICRYNMDPGANIMVAELNRETRIVQSTVLQGGAMTAGGCRASGGAGGATSDGRVTFTAAAGGTVLVKADYASAGLEGVDFKRHTLSQNNMIDLYNSNGWVTGVPIPPDGVVLDMTGTGINGTISLRGSVELTADAQPTGGDVVVGSVAVNINYQ